jgi:hypothetical protein
MISGGNACGDSRMITRTRTIMAMCVSTDVPAPTLDFALSKPKLAHPADRRASCDPRIRWGGLLPVDFAIRFESQPEPL